MSRQNILLVMLAVVAIGGGIYLINTQPPTDSQLSTTSSSTTTTQTLSSHTGQAKNTSVPKEESSTGYLSLSSKPPFVIAQYSPDLVGGKIPQGLLKVTGTGASVSTSTITTDLSAFMKSNLRNPGEYPSQKQLKDDWFWNGTLWYLGKYDSSTNTLILYQGTYGTEGGYKGTYELNLNTNEVRYISTDPHP